MIKNLKKYSKNSNGITLIALVITIIVLLILAGISISMLAGDNSILQKATDAKTNTEKVSIIEQARLDIMAKIADKKGVNLSDGEIKEVLRTYFTSDSIPTDLSDLTQELSTKSGGYTVKLSEVLNGVNIATSEDTGVKDKNGTVIRTTTETTPFLPDPANNEITNNDLDTGLTIKDGNNNEWVWIEVPKSVTASATDDAGIKSALENYIYVQNAKNTDGTDAGVSLLTKTDGTESTKNYKVTTVGYSDTWYDGCGLSSGDYAVKYSAMLNSIKENGGFYIGKYETGYELPLESTNFRNDSNKSSTSEHEAVIKQDAYPYNYVTCGQAEDLAEGFATGTKTATLMFGIQWDLVLKYLNNKGVSANDLTANSVEWGNYYDPTFTVTRGKYWDLSNDSDGFVNIASGSSKTVPSNAQSVLSAGATTRNMKMNIYDLAGNLFEWTLEGSSSAYAPCGCRGGHLLSKGSDYPVSIRSNYYCSTSFSDRTHGFRVSLY